MAAAFFGTFFCKFAPIETTFTMRFFRFFILLMAMAAVSCSHRSETYRQLVVVDSLLLGHNYEDSALSILKNIEPQTVEDTAYYNIIKTAAYYRSETPTKTFDGINTSIKYYTDNYDARKLAYAFYYKAIIFIDSDSIVTEIIPLLKKAEQYAERTTDFRLLDRIYSALTFANAHFGEFEESLNCAHKELFYSQKTKDNYCKAYALTNLSILHHCLFPNTDSARYYIQQCKMFADKVDTKDKALLYNYIGESLKYDNPFIAKQYFSESLKYNKLSEAYLNLAKMYYDEKLFDVAQKYCDSALINPSLQSKKETFLLMAEHFYKNNDIGQYRNAVERIMETQAQVSQEKENRKMLELQKKFDYEKLQSSYHKRVAMLCMTIVFLVIVAVLLYRIRVRSIENRRIAAELKYNKTQKELALTEERIATLQTDKKSSAMELAALKRKVEALRDTMRQNIQQGRKMYDELCANASPLGWSDSDLLCLFDYLSTLAPEFVSRLDTDYDGLNNGQKLFVIVEQYLKKSDFEICQMFGLEKSSLYNKRNRIVKKRVSAA